MELARLSGAGSTARAVFCAISLLLFALALPARAQTETPTPTPKPTPGGDCCAPHGGPGCDNDTCQACVCGSDSFCCDIEWDGDCADSAESPDDCAGDCGCPTATPTMTPTPGGDCCAAHDGASCGDDACSACVCALDDFCCMVEWDKDCADSAASPDDCRDQCQCKGDCCDPQTGPGCQQADCAACVCGQEEQFCCSDVWDETCVERANDSECGDICACEGLPGDCCTGNDTPGCNETACEACVCDEEPFCCSDVWDGECAQRAANPDGCGQICGCTGQIQSCCFAHRGSGCNNDACQACVCNIEEFCCSDTSGFWDNVCVERAIEDCGDVCSCGPPPASDCCVEHALPGCLDDAACEGCVCTLDDQCCQQTGVWDLTCVSEASNATECTGQCLCQPRAVDDCCVAEVDGGCSNTTCQTCVCGMDDFCCSMVWDRDCVSIASDECLTSCACQRPCIGDCFGLGLVSVADLLTGVNIMLDHLPLASCPAFDYNGDDALSIDEIVAGVDALLNGCR